MSSNNNNHPGDKTELIVKGDYFKRLDKQDGPWYTWGRADEGEVRHVEGRLCYAELDLYTYSQPVMDIARRESRTQTRVTKWIPYDSTQ